MHAWCPSTGAAIADSIPDSSSRRTQRSQSAIQFFLDSFRKVFLEVDAQPLLLQLKERFKLVLLGVFAKLLSDPFRELFFALFAGALDFGVDYGVSKDT